tara:strand:+ start:468 stop:2819 length:2352 start_codon:yes stop_codon:yes gene_type:complete
MKSFALGLVKGLTSGFTRNMALEQEARGADDQRVTDLENMIIEASLDPKKVVSKELGEMLKKAKTDLASRGSISPFGTQGPRLQLDMDKFQRGLASARTNGIDENNFVFGALKMPIMGKFYDATSELVKASTFLQSAQNFFSTQENRNLGKVVFAADPDAKKLFMNQMKLYKGLYENSVPAKYLALPNQAEAMTTINLDSLLSNVSKLGLVDGKTQMNIADSTLEEIQKAETHFADRLKRGFVLLPFFNVGSKSNEKIFHPFKISDPETKKALGVLASINGFSQEDYGSKAIPAFVLQYAKDSTTEIPVIPTKDQTAYDNTKVGPTMFLKFDELGDLYDTIFNSVELIKVTKGKPLFELNDKEQKMFFDKIAVLAPKDTGDRVRMVAPLIRLSNSENSALNDSGQVFNQINLKKRNKIFENIVGISPNDFKNKFTASERTMTQLGQLIKLRDQLKTSPGFAQWLQSTFGSIVADGGQIDQIKSILFGRATLDEPGGGLYKEGTTADTIVAILRKYQKANPGSLEFDLNNLSRAEALSIALAADMARAVDSNGRLSNQDFEKQLERLGAAGFFTTKGGSMARLATVFEDFNRQYNAIRLINNIRVSSESGFKSIREIQILKANEIYNALKGSLEARGAKETIITPNEVVDEYISEGFTTKEGGAVTTKVYSNGDIQYFVPDPEEDGKLIQINKNQLIKKSPPPKPVENIKDDKKIKIDPEEDTIGDVTIPSDDEAKGTSYSLEQVEIRGGNNRDGLTIRLKGSDKNLPGLYIQNQDGELVKKGS